MQFYSSSDMFSVQAR